MTRMHGVPSNQRLTFLPGLGDVPRDLALLCVLALSGVATAAVVPVLQDGGRGEEIKQNADEARKQLDGWFGSGAPPEGSIALFSSLTQAAWVEVVESIRKGSRAGKLTRKYYEKAREPEVAQVLADARLAWLAYEDDAVVRDHAGDDVVFSAGLPEFVDMQYFVVNQERDGVMTQVVVIRGTEVGSLTGKDFSWLLDVAADVAIDEEEDRRTGLVIPEGIYRAGEAIDLQLRGRLAPKHPVHLVGHSLGGSLATFLATRLEDAGYEVSATTFGSPKLVTFRSAREHDWVHGIRLTRITVDDDLFVHWPPPRVDKILAGGSDDSVRARVEDQVGGGLEDAIGGLLGGGLKKNDKRKKTPAASGSGETPQQRALLDSYSHFGTEWMLSKRGGWRARDMKEVMTNTVFPVQALDPSNWTNTMEKHLPERYVRLLAKMAGEEPGIPDDADDGA